MHYTIRPLKQCHVLCALLLAGCLLLSGCATVQVASPDIDLASKTITPPADKALVYVYRGSAFMLNSNVLYRINIDDQLAGTIAENTYLTALLVPGKHRITSTNSFPPQTLAITTEPGKTYFVEKSQVPYGLYRIEETKARNALASYKLIQDSERPFEPVNRATSANQQQQPSSQTVAIPSSTHHTEVAQSDIDTSIPTGKSAGKYDVAVVIGNRNYSSTGTPNIDFAIRDAQVMKEYLVKAFGYDPANIIYLENATLTKLNEVFGTSDDYKGKLYKWVKPGQSRIVIYYVGHGAPDQQTGEGYFVPVDANPQYISTSGYKLSTFYENISRIPAAHKIVVIDACFSGSSANGQLLKGVSGLTARLKSEPKATVATDLLLTSAGMDQVASWYPEKGHSLFTYFFLKGLQGAADTNKDGKITMGEMKAWLNDQVTYMARRLTGNEQQPVMLGKDSDELTVLTP